MEDQENRGFTSFDFITMLFSFAVIIAVSAPIIKKNFQTDSNVAIASQQTSALGQMVLHPRVLYTLAMATKLNKANRAIASVPDVRSQTPTLDPAILQAHLKKGEFQGEIGQDPWGQAYHYAFVRNGKGEAIKVVVWSEGPNKVNDSILTKGAPGQPEEFKLGKDDIGTITYVR